MFYTESMLYFKQLAIFLANPKEQLLALELENEKLQRELSLLDLRKSGIHDREQNK